ncbi:MAG: tRNA (adenosine(37)-N6)-threonylcarbamoyltransferase complex ATPase subunit type 1 TsaE [Verrucomicrobiales bacterium]|nr:tRNA (adenosine(37)-N6)-threonylcarbamoyltransferase complex ATPase subunit type 1 TsaE [Verrucomicrobiales bacterium]
MKKILTSEKETREFGAEIAGDLRPGDVLGLMGQLGAGKTHFTQGIVAALGSETAVTSPTFTLVNEYHDGRLPVFHFDFYRMDSPDEVVKIGWDEFLDEPGVVIVEWADKFPELLPDHTTWWKFSMAEDESRVLES